MENIGIDCNSEMFRQLFYLHAQLKCNCTFDNTLSNKKNYINKIDNKIISDYITGHIIE